MKGGHHELMEFMHGLLILYILLGMFNLFTLVQWTHAEKIGCAWVMFTPVEIGGKLSLLPRGKDKLMGILSTPLH